MDDAETTLLTPALPLSGGRRRVAVVGGGLAGLMTAWRVAERGIPVDLFSLVPCRRSHSVCAQGGINAAVNQKGEGDSPDIHFEETIVGGDFLAHQPPVQKMCRAAPEIVYLFDRLGVPFNRTPEGNLDFRRFGGTRFHRTAFAGATTGQQMLYALDEQVRRLEARGLIQRFEGWDFLSLVLDENGVCRGLVAQDLRSMEIRAFRADAVVLATGGIGALFGKSTNSQICDGSAQSAAYQQGAIYANPEMIQVHPTALPGPDKYRLISESVRGEGGRVWVPRDGKPWYFLEEWYPRYGNLVPRDIATRAIFKVCLEMGLGVDGEMAVYLDVRHLPREVLERKLGGVIDIYRKFTGQDPAEVPMKVFPAVHYTMGGLWVDYRNRTSIPGLFACGECNFQYHGANRLGANSLLSCVFDGLVAAPAIEEHIEGLDRLAADLGEAPFFRERRRQEERYERIYRMEGPENPFLLAEELGRAMLENCTVIRYDQKLRQTEEKILELKERWSRIGLSDRSRWANQMVAFVAHLGNMLELGRAIVAGALARRESRGAHWKPDFPQRDDENWLRVTLAAWTPDGPRLTYEPVDTSLLPPRPRVYA